MNIKALLGLALVVGAGYLAFMFMPPYFANFQFTDDVQSIAKFAAVNTRSEDDLRAEVMKKAREYELPIKPEQLKVNRTDRAVNISVDYVVVVNLVGDKQVPLNFHVASK
jgi:hypothetical protein